MQVLFGDTHVHTSFSMDASTAGNTRLTPADAYQFAKGQTVKANGGMLVKLDRPLDFLVVSDHAEYMGILPKLREADPVLLADKEGKRLFDALRGGRDTAQQVIMELIGSLITNQPVIDNKDAQWSIWNEATRIADAQNVPGVFSAMIGYEWTSMPQGDNLHRVVVYRDGADKAGQMLPLSAFDSVRPEDLWAFLKRYEEQTQGHVLAIPHNANVSNGRMFAIEDSNGKPMDKAYTALRAHWEPVVEVTQIKGDGETHPFLSPDDEFADFETWDKGNLKLGGTTPKTPDMLQYEYARSALKLGLQLEAATGVNPFKFGMIGSTDAHTSLSTAAESNFWGKASMLEPGTPRTTEVFLKSAGGDEYDVMSWRQVASGYAGVWATENTREAIFDALRRKEVFATTGTRITVRFFGGWEYAADDVLHPDNARIGYRKGVPMGGDLPAKTSQTPRFMVMALKDPDGANLDRIQIIKGWLDRDGGLHEKVYNVAVSDGRRIRRDGSVEALKSTVALDRASYVNSIGDSQLLAYWEDPAFESEQRAFYYARVIEIPTPRWTDYDAVRLGAEILPGTKMEVQDRAYTSPIWYTP